MRTIPIRSVQALVAHALFYRADGLLILRSAFTRAETEQIARAAEAVKTRAQQILGSGMRYWPGSVGYNESESRERRAQASWGVDELERGI